LKCSKCGKPITVTLPKKKWFHVSNSNNFEHKDEDTKTIDAVLIFLVNSGFKHNIWICRGCYDEWGIFHGKHFGRWEYCWNLWFNMREVVRFT
jgi:hypothetical protein